MYCISSHVAFLVVALTLVGTLSVAIAQSCCEKIISAPSQDVANSKEIVDIFTSVVMINMDLNAMVYIQEKEFWLTQRYNMILSRKGTVRIHILTDNPTIYDQGIEAGFYMHRITVMNDTFYDMYAPSHSSGRGKAVQAIWNEYWNFYRWLQYSEVIKLWNSEHQAQPLELIKNIMAVDLDVLLIVNPHKLYFRALNSLGFSSHTEYDMAPLSPGTVVLFSSAGISAYAQYIWNWYSRPRPVIFENIKSIGSFRHRGKIHVSDIQVSIEFAVQNVARRPLCFVYEHSETERIVNVTNGMVAGKKIDKCMSEALECVPTHSYDMLLDDFNTLQVKGPLVYVGHSVGKVQHNAAHPQCYMHFPTDKLRMMMKIWSVYLLRHSDPSSISTTITATTTTTSPSAVVAAPASTLSLSSPSSSSSSSALALTSQSDELVVNGHGPATSWLSRMMQHSKFIVRGWDPRMYLVVNGVRHGITSMEVFQKMHLLESDVMYKFPDQLLEAMPLGADINGSNVRDLCTRVLHCIPSSQPCCEGEKKVPPPDSLHENDFVDIFTYVITTTFKPEYIAYILDGRLWMSLRHATLLSKRNSTRFHIITDSKELYTQGVEMGFNMQLQKLGRGKTKATKNLWVPDHYFFKMYVENHISAISEGMEYKKFEYYNLYRWFKVQEYVRIWNQAYYNNGQHELKIKNIMVVDADLMFLVDPHRFYFRALHSLGYSDTNDMEISMIVPGALQLFSMRGLDEFCKFIFAWYKRTPSEITQQVATMAGKLYGKYHWTDAQMALLFSSQKESNRSLCFMYDPSLEKVIQMDRKHIDRCMVEALECVPTHSYELLEPILPTFRTEGANIFVGKDEQYPQCFMHFQYEWRKMIKPYTFALQPILEKQNAAQPPALRHPDAPEWYQYAMTQQLLIRDGETTKIYLIKDGKLFWVPTNEAFEKMHLKHADIISDIPSNLLPVLPRGEDIDMNNVFELCNNVFVCAGKSAPCCEHEKLIFNAHEHAHEVVDIFTSIIVSNFDEEDMQYIAEGDFWLTFRYSLLLTKRNTVRVHIVTDSDAIKAKAQEMGFYAHTVGINQSFYDLYEVSHVSAMGNHPSVVAYEYYNFYRWIKYSDIVQAWNDQHAQEPNLRINNIIAMDLDVMFLVNPHKFFFRVLHSLGVKSSDDFEMTTVSPGALQIFSAHGLDTYGRFIYEWFDRPRLEIKRQTERIASTYKSRLHFSDMQFGVMFAYKNEAKRSLCYQYDPALERLVKTERVETPRCIVEALECLPTNRYELLEEDFETMSIRDQNVYTHGNEKLPQCFLHFQGDKAKPHMKLWAIRLMQSLSHMPQHVHETSTVADKTAVAIASSSQNATGAHHKQHGGHHPAPAWLDSILNRQILVRNTMTGPIYVILNGLRHLVESVEVFEEMDQSEADTIPNFPPLLLNEIPLGPEITKDNVAEMCKEKFTCKLPKWTMKYTDSKGNRIKGEALVEHLKHLEATKGKKKGGNKDGQNEGDNSDSGGDAEAEASIVGGLSGA